MNRFNFSAKTLDEAITRACVELGVTSDRLDYSVVEQGSAGILGIGARPWVISACSLEELEAEAELRRKEAEKERLEAAAAERRAEEARKAEERRKAAASEKKEAPEKEVFKKESLKKEVFKKEALKKESFKKEIFNKETSEKAERPGGGPESSRAAASAAPAVSERKKEASGMEISGAEAEKKAEAFLKAVFDSIGMSVEIETSYDEMLSELSVNLNGEDMGILIGKRGQTLDSLQYLTGQVINKHGSGYIRVKLDTENYRERRIETLETLAHNMAHKVRRTRRPMALEPMNPYERRIIHSTLQDEKDVFTRSEGEEPYRHVVICYVKHKRQ